MVNTIQNGESRTHSVASGRDVAQTASPRKIEIECSSEATAATTTTTAGRLLRTRRPRPVAAAIQKETFIPMVQCKLPLDRINDILSKIKKTELSNVLLEKSDSLVSDLSVHNMDSNSASSPDDATVNSELPAAVEPSSPSRIMCLFCDRTFVGNLLLQKHTDRCHRISTSRRFSSRNVEQACPAGFHPGCNFCGGKVGGVQTATDLTALFNHLLDEHAARYFACRSCEVRFSVVDHLHRHNKDAHGADGVEDPDDNRGSQSDLSIQSNGLHDNIGNIEVDQSEVEKISKKEKNISKRSIIRLKSNNVSESDINDDSVTSTFLLPKIDELSKKVNIDQNAIIVLDNINLDNNKLSKGKGGTVMQPTKHEEKDNQILSRLGVAQNRTSRARSLRRSRKTPHMENRASSETPRKDKSKVKSDPHDFVINKNRNDPGSKFDPDFYLTVSSNVRENLMKHLDGKLDRSAPDQVEPKPKDGPAEIHSSDVGLNAISAFPTLLTSDQYGSDGIPDYSYGNSFKKIVTKNSWRWKWDPIKKYKYCNEDGRIVRKIRPLQHISPRDLSRLDMWTQLVMRERFEKSTSNNQQPDEDAAKLCKNERQKQIDELNTILDSRLFPNIETECRRFCNAEEILPENPDKVVKKELEPNFQQDTTILNELGLFREASKNTTASTPVLSGEWTRPRCYICCICGRRADCLKLLEAHQASHHPHVHATHYEIVGQDLLDTEVYKYLYLPCSKIKDGSTSKTKNESSIKQIKSKLSILSSGKKILRTTRSVKSLERGCTKCEKMLPPSEFYRHILECAGDYGWIMAKKKCKNKPFGARKRRLKGLYKREVPQEEDRNEFKEDRNTSRPKMPPRPRTKPSDAETIQRMLANLPAKRATRQIQDSPSPSSKGEPSTSKRSYHVRRLLDVQTNGKRNKIISSISSMKSALGKKVRHITRSLSNKQMPNVDNHNDETVPKDVVIPNNMGSLDKNISNNSKDINDQVKLLDEPTVTLKLQKKNQNNKNVETNTISSSDKNSNQVQKTRNISNSKNDVSSAVNDCTETHETSDKLLIKSLRTRPVVSSKTPNISKFPKISVNKENVNTADEVVEPSPTTSSEGVSSDVSVVISKNSAKGNEAKNKKKKRNVKFPLKWIGNKRAHFSKSRRAKKEQIKNEQSNIKTLDNTEIVVHEDEIESLKNEEVTLESIEISKEEDPNSSVPNVVNITTAISEINTSDECEKNDTPNLTDALQDTNKIELVSSETKVKSLSNQDLSCGNFSSSNNGMYNSDPCKNNHRHFQKNTQLGLNEGAKLFNQHLQNTSSYNPFLFSTGYNYAVNRKEDETIVEPIRGPNNAYYTLADNIDKPPLQDDNILSMKQGIDQFNSPEKIITHTNSHMFIQSYPSYVPESILAVAQKNKTKSKRGLNDCIAMLKGKLGEKSESISDIPQYPSQGYNSADDDIPQPLDLSGRIPQPEDLSMKSSNASKKMSPPPTPVIETLVPPKQIYDPILKIPQYTMNQSNAHLINISNTPAVQNYSLDVNKRTRCDFSIPSLLSPDKKIANNVPSDPSINYAQLIREFPALPEKLNNCIEKLISSTSKKYPKVDSTLPLAISNSTSIKSSKQNPKHHFIDDILSTKKSECKEIKKDVNIQVCMETKTTSDNNDLISRNVKTTKNYTKPCKDLENVNTDFFLIDPVTGMITERCVIDSLEEKLCKESNDGRKTKANSKTKTAKKLTKNDDVNAHAKSSENEKTDNNSSTISKAANSPAKRYNRKNNTSDIIPSPVTSLAQSTTSPKDQQSAKPVEEVISSTAIQQDEISSTQPFIANDTTESLSSNSIIKEDLITLSDIQIDESYNKASFRMSKSPNKRRNRKQKEANVLENPKLSENLLESKPKETITLQSNVKQVDVNEDLVNSPSNVISHERKSKENDSNVSPNLGGKVDKSRQVNSLNDLKMKFFSEKLMADENIIINESEFALTPTNNRELITNDKISKCENLTKVNLEPKDGLIKGFTKKTRTKTKIHKKILLDHIKDGSFSNNDVSSIAVAPQELSDNTLKCKKDIGAKNLLENNSNFFMNDESDDDDICLAEMAKKKNEAVLSSELVESKFSQKDLSTPPSYFNDMHSEIENASVGDKNISHELTDTVKMGASVLNETIPEVTKPNDDVCNASNLTAKEQATEPFNNLQDKEQNTDIFKDSNIQDKNEAETSVNIEEKIQEPILSSNLTDEDVVVENSSVNLKIPRNSKKKAKAALKKKNSSQPKKHATLRKSGRLSSFKNEKIAAINSVQLRENGHLIFKMQKTDASHETKQDIDNANTVSDFSTPENMEKLEESIFSTVPVKEKLRNKGSIHIPPKRNESLSTPNNSFEFKEDDMVDLKTDSNDSVPLKSKQKITTNDQAVQNLLAVSEMSSESQVFHDPSTNINLNQSSDKDECLVMQELKESVLASTAPSKNTKKSKATRFSKRKTKSNINDKNDNDSLVDAQSELFDNIEEKNDSNTHMEKIVSPKSQTNNIKCEKIEKIKPKRKGKKSKSANVEKESLNLLDDNQENNELVKPIVESLESDKSNLEDDITLKELCVKQQKSLIKNDKISKKNSFSNKIEMKSLKNDDFNVNVEENKLLPSTTINSTGQANYCDIDTKNNDNSELKITKNKKNKKCRKLNKLLSCFMNDENCTKSSNVDILKNNESTVESNDVNQINDNGKIFDSSINNFKVSDSNLTVSEIDYQKDSFLNNNSTNKKPLLDMENHQEVNSISFSAPNDEKILPSLKPETKPKKKGSKNKITEAVSDIVTNKSENVIYGSHKKKIKNKTTSVIVEKSTLNDDVQSNSSLKFEMEGIKTHNKTKPICMPNEIIETANQSKNVLSTVSPIHIQEHPDIQTDVHNENTYIKETIDDKLKSFTKPSKNSADFELPAEQLCNEVQTGNETSKLIADEIDFENIKANKKNKNKSKNKRKKAEKTLIKSSLSSNIKKLKRKHRIVEASYEISASNKNIEGLNSSDNRKDIAEENVTSENKSIDVTIDNSKAESNRLSKIYDIDEDVDIKSENEAIMKNKIKHKKNKQSSIYDRKLKEKPTPKDSFDVFDYNEFEFEKVSPKSVDRFSSTKVNEHTVGSQSSHMTEDSEIKKKKSKLQVSRSNITKSDISDENNRNKGENQIAIEDSITDSIFCSSDTENSQKSRELSLDNKLIKKDQLGIVKNTQILNDDINKLYSNSLKSDNNEEKKEETVSELDKNDIITAESRRISSIKENESSENIDNLKDTSEILNKSSLKRNKQGQQTKNKKNIDIPNKSVQYTLSESNHISCHKDSSANLSESDKESLKQEKYLADFGMFTEKIPRKSTILAIKKIYQTFKPDSSDTDDMTDKSSPNLRQSSKKRSKKVQETDVSVNNTDSLRNETFQQSKDNESMSDSNEIPDKESSLSDNKVSDSKVGNYCSICKRKFRRPENLLKHNTTLTHISKLSEMESKQDDNKGSDVDLKSSRQSRTIQISIHINPDNTVVERTDIEHSSLRPYKNLAERKSFDHEIPRPSFITTRITTPKIANAKKDLADNLTAESSPVLTEIVRKELSRDEALFFECCSLLKESETTRKTVREQELFETTPKDANKIQSTDLGSEVKSPIVYNLTVKTILQASEVMPKSLDKDNDEFLNEGAIEAKHSNNEMKKSDEFESLIKKSESNFPVTTKQPKVNKSKHRKSKKSVSRKNVLESDNDDFSEANESMKENNSMSSAKEELEDTVESYFLESLIVRTNSNDFSDNGDSLISSKDVTNHSKSFKPKDIRISSGIPSSIVCPEDVVDVDHQLKKNNKVSQCFSSSEDSDKNNDCTPFLTVDNFTPDLSIKDDLESKKGSSNFPQSELPSSFMEFEDKFDKIKRKAREKAQAAQEAMAAVISPATSSKNRKKSHSRSRKSAKSSSDSTSKSTKVASKNRKVSKKKNQLKELQKLTNKKILTKGARKVFDSIKISIPTEEINSNVIESDAPKYPLDDENTALSRHSGSDDDNCTYLARKFQTNCTNTTENRVSYLSSNNENSILQDFDEQQNMDIYEFYDEDDEKHSSRNFKFNSPTDLNFERSSFGESKNVTNTNNAVVSDKNVNDLQNDDSQISSLSFSDRDDFNYASEGYNQSGEDTNVSSNIIDEANSFAKLNKKNKMSKSKKMTKKSAIMGRIFKNNAIRHDQKPISENSNEIIEKDNTFSNRSHLDELFDSLLEKSASNTKMPSKNDVSELTDYCSTQDDTMPKTANDNNLKDSDSEFDDSDTAEKSIVPLRKNSRKIIPRLKARSSDDDISVNLQPKDITDDLSIDKGDSNSMIPNVGVANRKSQRKCTTGKQNVLTESWSSESDFEDFRQFEEYSSIPKSRHHRRPRRSRRHRDDHKISIEQNTSVEPSNVNFTMPILDTSPIDFNKISLYYKEMENDFDSYKVDDKKDSDEDQPVVNFDENLIDEDDKNPRKLKKTMFGHRRVSFTNNAGIKVQGSRRRRKPSQKPFDYDDEFKPTRIAEPLATQRRNKRAASEMLYYWSSSSDDEPPEVINNDASTIRESEPIEQHGWIVGDSHKKLVTMLAHAKGRKVDDKATVKEKKSRIQS